MEGGEEEGISGLKIVWMSGGEGGILASKYHADVRGDGGSRNRFPPGVGSGSFLERPIK